MTNTSTETVRIGDEYDDGDRFVTYGVTQDILNAWAEVDVFGRQLTEADV